MFFLEFHLEVFLLENFKSKPTSLMNSSRYQEYTIIGFCINLFALVVINQMFQNQYSVLKNSNDATNSIYEVTSMMCRHDKASDAIQYVFQSFFEDEYGNANGVMTM